MVSLGPLLVNLETYSYKKHNSDPAKAIRNGVLSTFDFLHNAHPVYQRTRNQRTSCTLLCVISPKPIYPTLLPMWHPRTPPMPSSTHFFYGLSITFILYLCLLHQSLHILHFSMVSPKSIYPTSAFSIPSSTNTINM